MTLEEHFEFISLDVVSLFTNVPLDLVVDDIKERWNMIFSNTKTPLDNLILALKLVLNFTYFTLNGTIYKQTLMG